MGRLGPFNEAKQALRRARRRRHVEITAYPTEVAGGPDPATGIAGIDLSLALRDLDPEDRTLLTMRYVLGFDARRGAPMRCPARRTCALPGAPRPGSPT